MIVGNCQLRAMEHLSRHVEPARRRHWRGKLICSWWPYVIPFLATAAYIFAFGVNVPVNDDWNFVTTFRAAHQSAWAFLQSVWSPHLEHRMPIPKLMLTALGYVSGFNVKLNMFASVLFVLIAYIGLVRLLTRRQCGNRLTLNIAAITMGVLMFSFVHYETWLLGYGLAFVSAVCFSLGAILVLSQERWQPHIRLGCSCLLCVLASFSAAQGLLSWLVILPSVFIAFEKRGRIWACASVVVLFVITCVIYRAGYHTPEWKHDPNWSRNHPLQLIEFALLMLGAPFCNGFLSLSAAPWVAATLCLAFSVLLMISIRRRCVAEIMPGISIALFGLGCSALIAFGRAPFGISVATFSRYMLFSVCLPIGVILMFSSLATSSKWKCLLVIVAGEMALLHISAVDRLIRQGETVRQQRLEASLFLEVQNYLDPRTDRSERSPLFPLYTVPGYVGTLREPANQLATMGYLKLQSQATFDEKPPFCGCFVSPAAGELPTIEIGRDAELNLSGWVVQAGRAVPDIVLISGGAQHSFIGGARVGALNSLDEVSVTNPPGPNARGWQTSIPADLLPDAACTLKAWAYDAEHARFLKLADCNGPTRVVVKPASESPSSH
jgi:hypothetical protein